MDTPDEEKTKPENGAGPLAAAAGGVMAGLRAFGRGVWALIKGAGKVAITVWRLAAALDSALWRAVKLMAR